MNKNGLTQQEIKTFQDLLIKANDTQIMYLLFDVQKEQQKRVKTLKNKYCEVQE
jgi:hypothetical protein